MNKTLASVMIVGLLVVGLGACGSNEADEEAARPTTLAPTTTAAVTTTPADPVLAAAKSACTAGESYGKALMTFLDDGVGAKTVAMLDPMRSALAGASGRHGVADLQRAVDTYQRQYEGYVVLYGQGETAYQPVKNAGKNVDELKPQAEEAWTAGVKALFNSDVPSAPSSIQRSC